MDVRNLNKTVKVKVSRAILHIIDQFIHDLIAVSGYAMRLVPTMDEARYCILHLWRKSHFRANILDEAQLQESLQESFNVEDDDDDVDYVPGHEERSDDESYSSNGVDAFSDGSVILDEENETLAESDRASDASDSSVVNLDWSFESESSVAHNHQSSSTTIIEKDFVSELMQYFQSEIDQRFRTNYIIRRPIVEMFAYFLSQQLQLSFQNDSNSLFIRAGYPAFGLMNTIYSQKEELREMRQLLEKQSSVLQNAEQLRKEFKNTTTISENIKLVVRNLNLENFDCEKIAETETVVSHRSNLSGEEEGVTFFTPSHLQEKLSSSANVHDNATNKEKDIENLKTALKTEKESNFYLRLRHEELKLVMSRLNELVYCKDLLPVPAPQNQKNLDNSNKLNSNNSTSRSLLPGEMDHAISINTINKVNNNSDIDDIVHNSVDSDTDDEYQKQHLPRVHSLMNVTFSPPAMLVKHSRKKRSLSHPSLQEAHDRSGSLTENKESPLLRFSYDFQERFDNPRALLVGHVQRLYQNETLSPIKRVRRSMSLHARQQQPGPHTPTMFDR